jgi:ribosomal-protein-alanine N-acetyltransferase
MPLPVVTPLTVDDLDAIMALENVCFKDPLTRRMYLADLTQNELATYLAVRLRTIVPVAQRSGIADSSPRSAAERDCGLRIPETSQSEIQNPRFEIVAYGGFWLMADEAHIATIASHPEWRGCGLGLYLMLALLDVAQAAGARLSTLEVRTGNIPAQRLYEKLGFEIAGRRRHYYRDGEDGLIMTTPPLAEPQMQARLAAAHVDALLRLEECLKETTGSRRVTTNT